MSALEVTLPQAVSGALLANPDVYRTIPLHIETTGTPRRVTAFLGDSETAAVRQDDATYVATLEISGLADGMYALTVTAQGEDMEASTVGSLHVSRSGVQLTDFFIVGHTGTPRLHLIDQGLWLTWTDARSSVSTVWLQEIDGGGTWLGVPVALASEEEDVLYARTVESGGHFGILSQRRGTPYRTFFEVVDRQGAQIDAPDELDPANADGNWGGSISHDGSGFVMAWMSHEGARRHIHWFRSTDTGQSFGPFVIASSGDDDPDGTFPSFSPVGIASSSTASLVTFVQDRWNGSLATSIPKSRTVALDEEGHVLSNGFAALGDDVGFHREARVWSMADRFLLLWSARDLLDGDDPPNIFYGTTADLSGVLDPARGAGATVLDAPEDRDEPTVVAHPDRHAVVAWIDHRAYADPLGSVGVQLYAATLAHDLTMREEIVFGHARVFAGLSDLQAIRVGTNVLLVWLDQRHSGTGVWDTTPEIWIDTVWY